MLSFYMLIETIYIYKQYIYVYIYKLFSLKLKPWHQNINNIVSMWYNYQWLCFIFSFTLSLVSFAWYRCISFLGKILFSMHLNKSFLLQKNMKGSFDNSKFYKYVIDAHHNPRLFEKCSKSMIPHPQSALKMQYHLCLALETILAKN